MFSDKTVHRQYDTKNGTKITINSNKVFNTYFELEILSFLLENGLDIELCSSKGNVKKIPEFVGIKDGIRINVEAKNLDKDKIMDHIFGDKFVEGFDYRPTEGDIAKGYVKIKNMLESNYENAIQKYKIIPTDEYFVLFISSYYKVSHLGPESIKYLNALPTSWSQNSFENLIGIVLPEEGKTYFVKNENCNIELEEVIPDVLNFHDFFPSIIKS